MNNQAPLLAIRGATISFAKKTLFENLFFNIFSGDKICLIGKNGVGKTTLMNAIAGNFELDLGERFIMPSAILGYLTQSEKISENLSVFNYIMQDLKLDEHKDYLIDVVCEKLKIDKNANCQSLSGGQKRRVNLAKALILEPEILLLDEPTNHLDLEIIGWLEDYLKGFKGALLIISHDRKFLEKTTNKVFWLRAGQLKINNSGYKNFESWSESIVNQEIRELSNLEKKFQLESSWLQTGVTARRKRNIGRLHYLKELKTKLESTRKLVYANRNQMNIAQQKLEEDAPQVILSFNNISKTYDDKKIINKFSLKILRGERIGIIGRNGLGKSTLLKMIVGEEFPDEGTVKPARDIAISYFDQARLAIKPTSSIQEILCESGGDYVTLANGKTKHICGYLKDFLFNPDDRETLASTLSGGQQNRLLLAKTLANPGNFMILDEPTNDLDMDSLDILCDYLEKYQGTLIVVSHDRDFLDNVATSILSFEGDGIIESHLGGYSDYLTYKENQANEAQKLIEKPIKKPEIQIENKNEELKKFPYKFKIELEKLPEKIEKLEEKILELSNELNESEDRNPANLAHISIAIANAQKELEKLENRWLELEEIKTKLAC